MLLLTGCINQQTKPPICFAEAEVNNQKVTIPIYSIQDVVNREYLAGYPFYSWVGKGQFIDMGNCQS